MLPSISFSIEVLASRKIFPPCCGPVGYGNTTIFIGIAPSSSANKSPVCEWNELSANRKMEKSDYRLKSILRLVGSPYN